MPAFPMAAAQVAFTTISVRSAEQLLLLLQLISRYLQPDRI